MAYVNPHHKNSIGKVLRWVRDNYSDESSLNHYVALYVMMSNTYHDLQKFRPLGLQTSELPLKTLEDCVRKAKSLVARPWVSWDATLQSILDPASF